MSRILPSLLLLPLFFVASSTLAEGAAQDSADGDIVVADFEGDTYGDWTVEGKAFGPGPARGALPGQMAVSGYLGQGLVNSFFEGDDTTGKLTSPKFRIERAYLSFLLGGGGHEGLAISLLIDGKRVREATGPNTVPGGSEALQWHDWDVAEFQGKEAQIEIVDAATGSWGHINVDQIVQSNKKRQWGEKRREITVEQDNLHIPIRMDAPTSRVRVEIGTGGDAEKWLDLDMPLALTGAPDFFSNLYVGDRKGKTLTFIIDRAPEEFAGFDGIEQAEYMAGEDEIYTERFRPRFHFSARTGWINDPNGLLYYKGTWHLFFQHNPYSTQWGNMTWGHATSPDLFHWTEHPAALHPGADGTMFSGSGVVDWKNTSGLGDGKEPPLVLIYTAWGKQARPAVPVTQGIAYSNDEGKTFTKYAGNPVVEQLSTENRDPKVIWHEASKQWVMALYLEKEDYVLLGSKDLKTWEKLSEIKNLGCSECPDFFPLPVDGDGENVKWVFWGANGKYLIGSFDGKEFRKELGPLTCKYGGHDYAAMTFSDAPDGRRVQISWMNNGDGVHAGMPFNHQMSVPRELTLRTTPQGVRLFMSPVKELETLREKPLTGFVDSDRDKVVQPNREGLLFGMAPGFDAELTVDVGTASKVILHVSGRRVEYDVAKKQIALDDIRAPLELRDGTLKLRLLKDTTSLELFAQDGEVQIAKCFRPRQNVLYTGIEIAVEGGPAVVKDFKSWSVKSVWKDDNSGW